MRRESRPRPATRHEEGRGGRPPSGRDCTDPVIGHPAPGGPTGDAPQAIEPAARRSRGRSNGRRSDEEGPAPERRASVKSRAEAGDAQGAVRLRGASPPTGSARGCQAMAAASGRRAPGPGAQRRGTGHGQRPPRQAPLSTTTRATRSEGRAARSPSRSDRTPPGRPARGRRRGGDRRTSSRAQARGEKTEGRRPRPPRGQGHGSSITQPERLTQVPRSRYRECTHHGRQ